MAQLDLTESLGNEEGDAVADGLLEAGDVRDEVSAQVVAVKGGPEAGVLRTLELRVERAELVHGFVELARVGGGGVDEVEGEGELRRGELRHGLDETVGDDLILESVGVELVPVFQNKWSESRDFIRRMKEESGKSIIA